MSRMLFTANVKQTLGSQNVTRANKRTIHHRAGHRLGENNSKENGWETFTSKESTQRYETTYFERFSKDF
jgi:hypothetical protein